MKQKRYVSGSEHPQWKGCIKARFEEKAMPEPNSGCFLWTAGLGSHGYGAFNMPGNRSTRSHRAAWMIFKGPIPDGLHVLHHCDNRLCVALNHLYLGTQAQNNADRAVRHRNADFSGSRSPNSKLTEDDARDILLSPETGKSLARKYGVRETTVSMIRTRQTWRHVQI